MPHQSLTLNGLKLLVCNVEGPLLKSDRDASDLIGDAFDHNAAWVVLPVTRFDAEFFRLSTRLAGDFLQKFVNYGISVAIVGDIAKHTAQSSALQDFVRESNRGRHVWFVRSVTELEERLEHSMNREK